MDGKGPKVATASVEILPDFGKFRASVERQFRRSNLRNQIKSELAAAERTMSDRLKGIGDKMTTAGSAMTKGITLPIVGIGAVSVKTALDFETAFAGVRKTVEGTEKQFASLERGLRDMSIATGTSAVGLAGIAEAGGQLGIATDDMLEFVKVVNQLDVATNLTAESAATGLGVLRNVLNLTAGDFDNLAAAVVALGNQGASTETQIVDMSLNIAASGRAAGLTTAEIIGLSAAVANVGIEAEKGGTAVSKTIQDISVAVAEGGKDLEGFAKIAGTSAQRFAQTWEDEPAEAIASFLDGLSRIRKQAGAGGVIKALKALGISETRQIDTLTRLANAQTGVNETLADSRKAYDEATAAQTEFDKFMKTNAKEIDKLKAQLTDTALTLGQALVPALTQAMPAIKDLAGHVASAARWFSELDPGTQSTLVKLAAGLAAFGPALRILGPGVSTLGSLVGWLSRLSKAKVAGNLATDLAAIGTNAGASRGKVAGLASSFKPLLALAATGIVIKVTLDVVKGVQEALKDPGEFVGNDPNRVEEVKSLSEALIRQGVTPPEVGSDTFFEFMGAMNKLEQSPEAFSKWSTDFYALLQTARTGGDVLRELNRILDEMNGKTVVSTVEVNVERNYFTTGGPADLVLANVDARQHGGPVVANRPFLVGEAGPELFVPSADGDIVPNGGFSKTTNNSITVGEIKAHDYHDFRRQMDREVRLRRLRGQ